MPVPLIIDVQLNDATLQSGLDKLVSQGTVDAENARVFKQTNAELATRKALLDELDKGTNKITLSVTPQQAIYNKLAISVKTLSGNAKDAAIQMLKLTPQQLVEGLKEAKVNIDDLITKFQDYSDAGDEATDSTIKLRAELSSINDTLTKLKLAGEDQTDIFDQLTERSKVLTKALNDQREVTRNLADDNPRLRALQSAVEGVTGAFEVGIGITGLFGEKNKELEETLIKVNSIMVFAQGAQQVFNTLKKESALSTFLESQFQKAANIQTALNTTIQNGNTVAKIAATIAQKALNIAIAANPIGLFTVLLVAGLSAMYAFGTAAAASAKQVEDFNTILEETDTGLINQVAELKRVGDQREDVLKEGNAKEIDITLNKARTLVAIQTKTLETLAELDKKIKAAELEGVGNDAAADALFKLGDERLKLQRQVFQQQVELDQISSQARKQLIEQQLNEEKNFADAQLAIRVQGSEKFFAAQRLQSNAQLRLDLQAAGNDESKKAAARAAATKRLREIDAAAVAQDNANELALKTANLLKIQTESRRINSLIGQEETEAQKAILIQEAQDKINALNKQAELDKSFRTAAADQVMQIQAKLNQDLEELNRQQLIRDITLANQNQVSRNNVILAGVKATNKERLALEIDNELDLRAIALTNTALTEDGKRQIIAESEEKIRQLNNAAIQKQAEDEIALIQATSTFQIRETQRVLDAQQEIRNSRKPQQTAERLQAPILNLDEQLSGIDDITNALLAQNKIAIEANDKQTQSEEDFTKKDAQLVAERVKIRQDGEDKKRALIKGTAEFEEEKNRQIIAAVLDGVSQGINIVSQLFAQQDQAAQERLDKRKQQIQEELDAGAITAKRAAEQQKELDAQQRQLQREQARRNKELALFQAIVNTATAVTQALTIPLIGEIQAIIVGALGAAQIALIASQPLPQFYLGKNQRDNFEGWGVIGDRGPELWQSGSQMKVADRATTVWLKKSDIVYNATQTEKIMKSQSTSVPVMMTQTPVVINVKNGKTDFDYKKMADAIAKRVPIEINIDGYKTFVIEEQEFTQYLYNRKKWIK